MSMKSPFFLGGIITAFIWGCIPTTSENENVSQSPQTQRSSIVQSQSETHTSDESSSNPEQVVRDFYRAISENKCAKAARLRPGYSKQRCLNIHSVDVKKVITPIKTSDIAVVYLDVDYQLGQNKQSFFGHVKLVKRESGWIIVNDSYVSANQISLKQYLQQHNIQPVVMAVEDKINQESNNPLTPSKHKAERENGEKRQASHSPMPPGAPTSTLDYSTFGSLAILNRCWTSSQLSGSPQDKKVRRPISNPYRQPPEVMIPYDISPIEPRLRYSIRRIIPEGNKKIVALTFDLCERTKEKTGYDAAIVNYLRKHGIKATFYAGGKWMHSHPDKAMQLMADPLFEIGNHAWTHGNLRVLKGQRMEDQILWTQGQYEVLWAQLMSRLELRECPVPLSEMEKIPPVPLTFRFPYGTCNADSLNFLAESGLPAIQWDVVTADPSSKQSATAIAKTVLRNVKPGSIIIAHANGRGYNTAKALPLFIPNLKKRGYQFMTVTELLKSGKVVSAKTCYELKQGDNLRYDRIFGEGTE